MQKLIWQNANGDEINLTSGNYGITEWEGFSNASLNIQSQQVPFQDGGVFLDALIEQRELSVTLKMQDNGNLEERYRMRRELIHALNPKLGEGYLIYTNDFTSKRIKCTPQIPLFPTHNSNDSGTPSASLAWTACEPYWEDLEETQVVLNNGVITNIQNEGDVDIGFKAVINPSCVNPEIVNLIEEKKIKIQKSITENTEINTDFGKKSIEEIKYNYKYAQGGMICSMLMNNSELYIGGDVLTKFNSFNKNVLIKTITSDSWARIACIAFLNNKYYLSLIGEKKIHITEDFETITETTELPYLIKKIVTVNSQVIILTEGYAYKYDNNAFTNIYEELKDLCYYNGYYYGIKNTELKRSQDLETWETVEDFFDILDSRNLYNICYNNDICIILAISPNVSGSIISSTDLNTWNQTVIEDANNFIWSEPKLCFCNNMFFFISVFDIYTTSDGVNINKYNRPIYFRNGLTTIMTDGNSVYIGNEAGQIIITTDGVSYSFLLGNILPNFSDIKYYNGKYYGTGSLITTGENGLFESNDCKKWIFKNADFQVGGFTYFINAFYGTKSDGNKIYILKYDGNLCSEVFNASYPQYGSVFSITVDNGKICAVTSKGCVVKSSNGVQWDIVEIDASKTFRKLSFCNNQFVIVGNGGNIYTSENLTEWTHLTASFNENITDIIFNNGYYLLYTEANKIYKTNNLNSFELVATSYIKNSPFSLIFSHISFFANGTTVISTTDGSNFEEEKLGILSYLNYVNLISGHNGKFLIGEYNFLYDSTEQKTNIIDKLTSDSDMSLKLKAGKNQYKTQSQSGNFTTVLSYRQKYIGV